MTSLLIYYHEISIGIAKPLEKLLHRRTSKPNTLVHTSPTQASSLKRPTFGLHHSNCSLHPLNKLGPKSQTLSSSKMTSNSNKMRGPPNKDKCKSPFSPQECNGHDFNESKINIQSEETSHLCTRHFLSGAKLLKTSSVSLSIQTASPTSLLPLFNTFSKEAFSKRYLLPFPPNVE